SAHLPDPGLDQPPGAGLSSRAQGAFIPGVPVQPVVLRYPNKLVSAFSWAHRSRECPGPENGPVFQSSRQFQWKVLCQPLLCQGGGRVVVAMAEGGVHTRASDRLLCTRKEGPRPVCQQRAPRDGRVSEPRATPPPSATGVSQSALGRTPSPRPVGGRFCLLSLQRMERGFCAVNPVVLRGRHFPCSPWLVSGPGRRALLPGPALTPEDSRGAAWRLTRPLLSCRALGVSVTDYTFEDCQLALAEGQLRLPADTCLLEFARLLRGLGLKPEKLEQDLDRHAESARMKQGRRVTLPEFAAQLGVPESESLEDLFSLFDEGGGGEVDLREYVVALSVVCRPARTLDTIQLAFKMYGSQDGSVDEHALSSILKTALGVAELTVTDLFRAIDQERKGRIAFADFERFAEATPNFAEEYLYPEQTRLRSCARTPPAPTPNGFCADFSPESSAVGTEPVRKKLD
ncbi:hypothetical protein FD754_012521, partial [Muntiacus muntjak]